MYNVTFALEGSEGRLIESFFIFRWLDDTDKHMYEAYIGLKDGESGMPNHLC